MDQPALPGERYGYRSEPNSYRTHNGTRVILVGNVGGSQTQQTAKPSAAPRKSFRFRRR